MAEWMQAPPGGSPDAVMSGIRRAAAGEGAGVVLIVDDIPDNLAVLHDALDESGYTVLVATDGASAIARAAQALPDIVLLDALMPGMDGFEVARRLKADEATAPIPIVFMTALTDTEHVLAAFAAGGVDYVSKPVRPREVVARIAAHLQSARHAKQARNALDAFGHASIALRPADGRVLWQTPLARDLMKRHFGAGAAAAVRVSTPSFSNTCSRCLVIVFGRVPRMSPMSRLVLPGATQYSTSASRAVSRNCSDSASMAAPLLLSVSTSSHSSSALAGCRLQCRRCVPVTQDQVSPPSGAWASPARVTRSRTQSHRLAGACSGAATLLATAAIGAPAAPAPKCRFIRSRASGVCHSTRPSAGRSAIDAWPNASSALRACLAWRALRRCAAMRATTSRGRTGLET